jgi:hypothetical protein
MAYRRKKSGSTIYTESYGNGSPRKTRTSGRQKTGKTTSYSTKNGKTTLTTHMNVGGKVTRTTQTVGRTQKSKVKHTTSKVYKQPKNENWLGMKKTRHSYEGPVSVRQFLFAVAAYGLWLWLAFGGAIDDGPPKMCESYNPTTGQYATVECW